MKYPMVQKLAAEGFPVRLACGVLRFSSRALAKWQSTVIPNREWKDASVTNVIVNIDRDDPEFWYRLTSDGLEPLEINLSELLVNRLCRDRKVWSTTVKKGGAGSGRRPWPASHDDLVMRIFTAPKPSAVWMTDITEQRNG